MAKKLYDIVPPEVARKKKNTVKAADVAVVKKPRKPRVKAAPKVFQSLPPTPPPPTMMPPRPISSPMPSGRRFPVKEVVLGVLIVVALLGVWGYIKLPKADVQIWPSTAVANFSEKVAAKTSVKSSDASSLVIPAQYVEVQKDVSQQFPATGSASDDGRASGTITVYNKISPAAPFTLVKGTHFLSDSGKYFLTMSKVTVPAMKGKTPGSVQVQVQAEQSGDDYNIGASKFSIPKLNGTVYYYSLYGQSTNTMTGGYAGKVKQVTNDDLASAKEIVTKNALQEAKDALKASLSDDQVLLDGAVTATVVSASADAKALAAVQNFTEKATAKASALVYKKGDLDQFVGDYVKSHVSGDSSVVDNSLDVKSMFQSLDVQKGIMQVSLQVAGKTYHTIDKDGLINMITSKTADGVKQTVDQLYPNMVDQLKVNFWPFWVNKVPSNTKRINVDLLF
jgi:hypothetical protein